MHHRFFLGLGLLFLSICVALPGNAEPPKAVAEIVTSLSPPLSEPTPTPIPPGTPMPAVAVAEPAAPPPWAQELIVAAQALPVVGPFVAKALLYVGILSSILTSIVACLLAMLNTLIGAANLAKLTPVAQAIAAFRDGKIMYWLRFFSLFNAKKPDPRV